MMKKFMMGAAAFCCMVISMVALTACGSDSSSDSGSDSGSGGDTYALKGAVMEVKFREPQDILEVCDVKVTINGAEEAVTSSDWTKTVKLDALPAHFSVQVKMTKKEGKDWDPEKTYSIFVSEPLAQYIYVINNKGDKVFTYKHGVSNNFPTDIKGVAQMDIAMEHFGEYSGEYTINKNGEEVSWIEEL